MFDISGTWRSLREAKRFYGRLGYPERVDLVEADVVHGFFRPLREGMARWMRRWLLGIDDVLSEDDSPLLSEDEGSMQGFIEAWERLSRPRGSGATVRCSERTGKNSTRKYDLPDLLQSLSGMSVTVVEPADGAGEILR